MIQNSKVGRTFMGKHRRFWKVRLYKAAYGHKYAAALIRQFGEEYLIDMYKGLI